MFVSTAPDRERPSPPDAEDYREVIGQADVLCITQMYGRGKIDLLQARVIGTMS
jgi:hypothetical protein